MYIYDENWQPLGMQYHGANYAKSTWDVYWFEKNLFGDIISVRSNTGTLLAQYKYNAYGECTVTYSNSGDQTAATLNPFRYRGYYFDKDLNLYYVNARYYDAKLCRWISPDAVEIIASTPMSLSDNNLYAYCDNNPVNRVDYDGEWWHIVAGTLIGGAVGAVSSILGQLIDDGNVEWSKVGVSAGAGALSGALATVGAGPIARTIIQVGGNAIISAGESIINQSIDNGFENVDYGVVAFDAIVGGLTSIGNGLSKGEAKHLMTQGINATKQLAKKGWKKTVKYYFSQTTKMYYKPLIRESFEELIGAIILP